MNILSLGRLNFSLFLLTFLTFFIKEGELLCTIASFPVLEHGELALHRQPRYRSMVFGAPQLYTNGLSHMMETNGLTTTDATSRESVNSLDSKESATKQPGTWSIARLVERLQR